MKHDFVTMAPYPGDELLEMISLARWIKQAHVSWFRPLANKTAAIIFEKPSLRTHLSFEVGILQLGGQSVFLSRENIGIAQRETVRDVAEMLSQYNDIIVIRTFRHEIVAELASYASIPVINALDDLLHPCQIMADAMTLMEHGTWSDSMKVAFIGDGNNVANSWLELAEKLPFHLALACPEGYDPDPAVLSRVRKSAPGTIELLREPREAAAHADVLYTDVWVSMGQEQERSKRMKAFRNYQVNAQLLKNASPGCVVMHCLPAHRGEEITADILEGPRSLVLAQAKNRLHVQKGILAHLTGHRLPTNIPALEALDSAFA